MAAAETKSAEKRAAAGHRQSQGRRRSQGKGQRQIHPQNDCVRPISMISDGALQHFRFHEHVLPIPQEYVEARVRMLLAG
jgi:hypothetical protein